MKSKIAAEGLMQSPHPMNELLESRVPVMIWLMMVFSSAMILQNFYEPLPLRSSLFTVTCAVHGLVHWYSNQISKKLPWIYFLVQGLLVFGCASLMPVGFPAVLFGMLPVLVAQSIGVYHDLKRVGLVAVMTIVLFFDSILTVGKMHTLLYLFPLFILMMIIVVAYGFLFFQQVQARLRTQSFLRDLEAAHNKVEELTLANERQRMARDLHDTLAQGVASLIMQLEAADAHLEQNNHSRSQEIIRNSMVQARTTLAEARRAIDDLREISMTVIDLNELIVDEVRHFTYATGIEVQTEFNLSYNRLPKILIEHVLHIVRESLTNVGRHSAADKVWVKLSDQNRRLQMEVGDNGCGFNQESIGKQPGHYGLLGMHERGRLVGGQLSISSSPSGTVIFFETDFSEEGKI
jgi:NarL family two-component system sensor histidine kinase YdfH